jgi:hypothetical protein
MKYAIEMGSGAMICEFHKAAYSFEEIKCLFIVAPEKVYNKSQQFNIVRTGHAGSP